ncbi:ABC transporter substrate-binding protein [Sciscionella marina]|uniref:ABC transporter substrate-binding protein n=1 Tax=Sciscionella marina TaxID=508770 RepID=UPI000371DC34|nr:ABC transporter substrate-binding protein [Sciscionella marina]
MKRTIALCAVLLALCASVAGCRDSRTLPMGADGKPKITIMVGGLDKVIYLPAMLTERLGGFRAQGIDVSLLSQPDGATAETSLLAGEVAGVVGFYDHTIDLQAKDQCLKSVVQFANVPGEVEMVAANKAGRIRGWRDVRGHNLGITSLGSSTDFLSKALANRAGVHPDEFTPVKVGAGQTFIANMDNQAIDAGMTTDPTVARLTSTGKGRILTDLRTEQGTRAALGGLYPASSLYMSCQIVQRYPDIAQKLTNALVGTLRWMKTHTPEQIAAKMPPSFASGGKELYERSIADSVRMFNGDGRMNPEGARNVLNVLSEFSVNVKPRKDRIDLAKTYTTRFVDRVPR